MARELWVALLNAVSSQKPVTFAFGFGAGDARTLATRCIHFVFCRRATKSPAGPYAHFCWWFLVVRPLLSPVAPSPQHSCNGSPAHKLLSTSSKPGQESLHRSCFDPYSQHRTYNCATIWLPNKPSSKGLADISHSTT